MPAKRTARSSERKRITNRRIRSATRTVVGKAVDALRSGEAEKAEPAVKQAVSSLDRATSKGIMHRNTAARKKSRLMAKLNALGTP